MTSEDVAEGVKLTLGEAHKIHRELGRLPWACEIRWRLATRLQQRWPHLERRSAMLMATQLMDVVREASTTT